MKFRHKPTEIEATQTTEMIAITTLEGTMIAMPGDYIITGTKGEMYPCRKDIFEEIYEPVDNDKNDPFWFRKL